MDLFILRMVRNCLFVACCFLLLWGVPALVYADTVDNFDSGVIDWSAFGEAAANVAFNPLSESGSGNVQSGLSMRVVLDFASFPTTSFSGVFKDFSSVQSWSNFNQLSFWVKSGQTSTTISVQVGFTEASGEQWTQIVKTTLTSSFQQVTTALNSSNFQPAFGTGDRVMDLSQISQLSFTFFRNSETTLQDTYVDEVEVTQAAPSDSISATTSLDFGVLSEISQVQSPIAISTPVDVRWENTFSAPWRMVVYTDNRNNSPVYAGDFDVVSGSGIVGEFDPRRAVGLKVWCANFGPAGYNETTGPPDPANTQFFRNNEEGWFRVPDVSESAYFPRTLMALTDTQDSRLGNPFQVWFAADFNGAPPQQYRGTVFFNFINE